MAPARPPLSLKCLLLGVFLLSAFSPFLAPYLLLSLKGIENLHFWQFFTYAFIHPFPSGIVHLAFNLFLIWIFGASLIDRLHPPLFYSLFFGGALFGGLAAWGAMTLFHLSAPLFGSTPPLYALLTSWILLNPEARVLLFFALPFKARHLLAGLIGLNLLIDLSRTDWLPLFAYLGATLFGYFFTLIVCKTRSPFHFLAPFENGILRLIERVSHLGGKEVRRAKIYDIKSGEPILGDEEFMDAMLARISLYGEENLSPDEKKRMQRISEKKALRK